MNETYATLIGIGVQTILYLLAGYGLVVRNDTLTKSLKDEVKSMQLELKGLAEVITVQAVQSTRIDNLGTQLLSIEKRVEDMRRGEGFVRERRKGVDGEYP